MKIKHKLSKEFLKLPPGDYTVEVKKVTAHRDGSVTIAAKHPVNKEKKHGRSKD